MPASHANAHPADALVTDADRPERLDRASLDVAADRAAQLRELFPEAVREGEIDFDALKRSVGKWVDPGKERFGLTWPGKAACMKVIQQPSVATLLPDRAESVEFDATQNVIIEGDNLEVLKLLQKGYYGTVKMIYIDPPYNTGNEFIYPDNFQEGLQTYLRYSGQVDATGARLSTNTETSGRYHTNWLNMMYPRLYLARNLLREDGVIFVSIDDNEVANLRAVMNEVFGEENFVATVVWQKKQSPQRDATYFSDMHDFILVYARRAKLGRGDSEGFSVNLLERNEEQLARYKNPDDDPRGNWASIDCTINKTSAERPNLYYGLTNPFTSEEVWPSNQRVWTFEKPRMQQLLDENRLWWGADGRNFPRLKSFISEVQGGVVPSTLWLREYAGDNQEAARTIRALFPQEFGVFDTPKPTRLIERMLEVATNPDDNSIVMDFFAGSGTTADAVLRRNADDGGNRQYLLVQLPEPTGRDDFPSISAVCRERVRRAIGPINKTRSGQLALDEKTATDLGFRAYRLAESNFVPWDGDPGVGSVARQLELAADNLRPGREQDPEAILTEILLRAGYALTAPVQRLSLGGADVFSVDGGALMACLHRPLTMAVIEAMAERDPAQIVVLDAGFAGDDQLKVNAVQAVKARPNTVLKVV